MVVVAPAVEEGLGQLATKVGRLRAEKNGWETLAKEMVLVSFDCAYHPQLVDACPPNYGPCDGGVEVAAEEGQHLLGDRAADFELVGGFGGEFGVGLTGQVGVLVVPVIPTAAPEGRRHQQPGRLEGEHPVGAAQNFGVDQRIGHCAEATNEP